MRHVEERFQVLARIFEQSHLVQVEDGLVFLEESKHDGFAVHAGDC